MVALIKSLVLAALATSVSAKSAVIDLIPDNFDKLVYAGKPTLVEFFAPWCGHCKKLAPIYEELALAFEHASDKVQIAKVDADAEKELGKRFDVQGFPTLKFFDGKSKEPTEYNSGRELEDLMTFITEKTGVRAKKNLKMPSQVEFLTDETFATTIGGDKNVLVAFTAPWCGHCKSLAPIWEELAYDYTNDANVVIAKVDAESPNSKSTAEKFGVTSYPTIKFFAADSTDAVAYESGRTESAFIEFINKKAGTHRVVGGDLDDKAGTLEILDEIVAKFTGGTALSEVAEEAKKAVKALKDDVEKKASEYYVRVFDKLSKNEGYVAKELARLDGIFAKGGLAATKRDEIQRKLNVLRKFTPKAEEEAEEKTEEETKDEL